MPSSFLRTLLVFIVMIPEPVTTEYVSDDLMSITIMDFKNGSHLIEGELFNITGPGLNVWSRYNERLFIMWPQGVSGPIDYIYHHNYILNKHPCQPDSIFDPTIILLIAICLSELGIAFWMVYRCWMNRSSKKQIFIHDNITSLIASK